MIGRALILLVRLYQWTIAPALPPTCRFFPSCSQYMVLAIQEHGALKGGALGLRRLLRCHPFGGHGVDPVPPKCGSPERSTCEP
ncbi:MAG TPA: membrane protein insertion efficiency factor YidD [Planctomycetota bacterium]|nr:membrane protein insertion efficiency factor YidD [Planctomycetota bacterium]